MCFEFRLFVLGEQIEISRKGQLEIVTIVLTFLKASIQIEMFIEYLSMFLFSYLMLQMRLSSRQSYPVPPQ